MKFMKNDTIQVAIKKQARNYVLRYYAAFGWEFVEEKEDTRYEDTAHLSFERPHYIDNKDDLHLLQAKLEIAMNKAGKYESRKNTRATIFGIMTGLLAAGFMAGGVCLIVLFGTVITILFGGCACIFGVALSVVCGVFSYKIYKQDTKKYNELMRAEIEKIENYCNRAKTIRGEL